MGISATASTASTPSEGLSREGTYNPLSNDPNSMIIHFPNGERIEIKEKSEWFQDAVKKINFLMDYEHNWGENNSQPLNADTAQSAIILLVRITQNDTPEPIIRPTPSGGIQFEWHTEHANLEVEFIDHNTILVLFDGRDNEERDWEMDVSLVETWVRLIHCTKELI